MSRADAETKRILVTVKASPEPSTKYRTSVCVAGITTDREWIRLYPVPLAEIMKKDIPRYSWIEAECYKDTHHDQRKESYKIVPDSIRIVESPRKKSGMVDWDYRNEWILPLLSNSMADLERKRKEDNTSLGLIKPVEVRKFFMDPSSDNGDENYSNEVQLLLTGSDAVPVMQKTPHPYKYEFTCASCAAGECTSTKKHSIVCIDWELGEAYRSWKDSYTNPDVLQSKISDKFFNDMLTNNDLYFYMGTHYRFKKWMIIGLYYPQKKKNATLADFNL
jgi:hypothetical protein